MLILQTFKISGIDLDRLPCSSSTIFEKNCKAREQIAMEAREKLTEQCKGRHLILHFDSKMMEMYKHEVKLTEPSFQLTISVSSIDMYYNFEFSLCAVNENVNF